MRLKIIFFAVIAFIGFSLAAHNVYACTNPQVPQGFANPCPVFSVTPTSTSATGTITVTATPGSKQYVSEQFYVYNGNSWSQYQFQGVFGAHGYTTSTATYTLSSSQLSELPSGNIYLAEWDWTYSKALYKNFHSRGGVAEGEEAVVEADR
jgi:hypothetical protein